MTTTLAGTALAVYAALAVVAASFAAPKKSHVTRLQIENAQKNRPTFTDRANNDLELGSTSRFGGRELEKAGNPDN